MAQRADANPRALPPRAVEEDRRCSAHCARARRSPAVAQQYGVSVLSLTRRTAARRQSLGCNVRVGPYMRAFDTRVHIVYKLLYMAYDWLRLRSTSPVLTIARATAA